MERSIDREKVIKGLQYCFATANCDGCPYEIECRKISFKTTENHCPILDDVLDLLKEQEVVKPIKKDTVEITARYEFDCPCGAPLLIGQPYCANCGRSVKWE